jgi:hypothetical protein
MTSFLIGFVHRATRPGVVAITAMRQERRCPRRRRRLVGGWRLGGEDERLDGESGSMWLSLRTAITVRALGLSRC